MPLRVTSKAENGLPGVSLLVERVLGTDRLEEVARPFGPKGLTSSLGIVEHCGRRLVIKAYRLPFLLALRTWGRASRAQREHEALEALEPLVPKGVPPVAWGERRTLGLAFRSVLVTELVDAVDLKTWRLELERGERPSEDRARLVGELPALVDLVRRVHDAGFYFGGLLAKNTLWRPRERGERAFAFLDLPFSRRSAGPIPWSWAARDLAALDKSARLVLRRRERLELFLRYLGRTRVLAEDAARLRLIARLRARREHATPLWRLWRSIEKWLKRTSLGRCIIGRDPNAPRRW